MKKEKADKKVIPQEEIYDTPEEVENMLSTWDKVNCYFCGKEISMLNAKFTENQQHFICKDHE